MTLFANERAYDGTVNAAAARYGVPPDLVRAVIAVESGFRERALRGEPQQQDASRGLMQLLLSTAHGLGWSGEPDALFLPGVNIPLGVRHLRAMYDRAGTWDGAVSAYNGGYRPEIGFGELATRAVRVCLAWKATAPATGRSLDRDCAKIITTTPGQYANQDYVNRVARYYEYFRTGKLPSSATAILPAALAVLGAWAFS